MTVEDIQDEKPDEIKPSKFEIELSKAAHKVILGTKTGYAWNEVDKIVAKELEADGQGPVATRCKKANNSGRAANVLTESNDKDIALYLVFCVGAYSAKSFRRVAVDRIRRFPKVVNVAIFMNEGTSEDPFWSIAGLVHRSDQTLPSRLMKHFPTLTEDKIIEVQATAEGELSTPLADAMVEQSRFADLALGVKRPMERVPELPGLLSKLAAQRGLNIDQATVVDVLACALSSHLLLFAGPSGTGKSALARLLAEFFVPTESLAVVEARHGWLGPEDVAGYYSALTTEFAATTDTETFLLLHNECQGLLNASEDAASVFSPILLVEEANMSVVEAYLAPITHGLSATSVPTINWALHNSPKEHTFGVTEVPIPQVLQFGPWPRVFATINVDSTSPAPARKVTGRGLVVLLEPREMELSAETAASILASAGATENDIASIPENILGNPAAVLDTFTADDLGALLTHLNDLLGAIAEPSRFQPSRRDLNRAALYMCWYVRLCEKMTDVSPEQRGRWAAQNAFLHVFLPQMSAKEFNAAVTSLSLSSGLLAAAGGVDLGVLQPRLVRLERARKAQIFPDSVDFWASLS